MQNLVEDKFDLRSHGSNGVFFLGGERWLRDYTLLAIANGV